MPEQHDRRQISLTSNRSRMHIDNNFPSNQTESFYVTKIDFFPSCITITLARVASIFYLAAFILQIFFDSPLDYTISFIPFVITFVSSAIVDIIRIFRRTKLTAEIDRRKVTVLRDHSWVVIPSRALIPGDIIKLNNGDIAPADLILLTTANSGQCGIDTHIIDGSKQLKARKPNNQLSPYFTSDTILNCNFENVHISRSFNIDHKLTSKIKFQATVNLDNSNESKNSVILNNSQFIERYSIIYQVSDVICAVAFTGIDCRNVSYEQRNYRVKMSHLELLLNRQCAIQLGLMAFLAVLMSLFSFIFYEKSQKWPFYISYPIQKYFLTNLFNYSVLLLTLCPIEIYFLIDLILFIHTLFISSENNTTVLNSSAIDELTQVDSMILSKSLLVDKKINILRIFYQGIIYGKGISSYQYAQGIDNRLLSNDSINLTDTPNLNFFSTSNPYMHSFKDDTLGAALDTRLLFLHLCLCNAAVPIIVDEYIGYISNFVEEEPLLKLAETYGYTFYGRSNVLQVKIFNTLYSFPILITFPPSPTHPRVSVIIRDIDGTIKLFTRGEVDKMREYTDGIPTEVEKQMKGEGLQILCLSYKIFTNEEVAELQRNIPMILRARPEAVFVFANSLEKNSKFLSLIAFQEEPRSGSIELINHAKRSNIQLILVSPFKMSSIVITALSLGFIRCGQKVGIINGDSFNRVREAVNDIHQEDIEMLILSSSSIEFLPKIENAAILFKKVKKILIEKADPQQAAQFVSFLRNIKIRKVVLGAGHSLYDSLYLEKTDLSIAVKLDSVSPCSFSCDISTDNLESIDKMIYVHGNWLRDRITYLIHYIYPKDSVLAFFSCVYGFHSALSGTPLFTEFQLLFLIFLTSIPAISRSILNQKETESYLRNNPEYYDKTRWDNRYSFLRFWLTTFFSSFGAAFVLELTKLILVNSHGQYQETISLHQFSYVIESIFFISSVCILAPNCTTWTSMNHFLIWGSVVAFFICEATITSTESSGQRRGSVSTISSNVSYSLVMILVIGVTAFMTISFSFWQNQWKVRCSQKNRINAEYLLNNIPSSTYSNYVTNVEKIYN